MQLQAGDIKELKSELERIHNGEVTLVVHEGQLVKIKAIHEKKLLSFERLCIPTKGE